MIKLSSFKALHKFIDTANNGKDCLKKIKAARESNIYYSLIFMDLSMPIMDGYEASKNIRDYRRSNIKP